MAKQILAFQVKTEKLSVLRKLGKLQRFELRTVPLASYDLTLGQLCKETKMQVENRIRRGPLPVSGFPMEMIVFAGFSSAELDRFLDAYKLSQQEPILLKAVVTPYNMTWTPRQLFQELLQEHLKMK